MGFLASEMCMSRNDFPSVMEKTVLKVVGAGAVSSWEKQVSWTEGRNAFPRTPAFVEW